MNDKVTVSIYTQSSEGEVVIFTGSERAALLLAKSLAPNLRDFKESDYKCFGGAEMLPSGDLQKIYESDTFTLIVSSI